MPLQLDIVTAERLVYSEQVDALTAPGIEGELGILPHHAPLLTPLTWGELKIRKGGQESYFAIGGGFLEVRPDRVIVLADAAERDAEIDEALAEEARKRAQERLAQGLPPADAAMAVAAIRRASLRLKVARRRARRSGPAGV